MAKITVKKTINFIMALVGIIASIAIGGTFIAGGFQNVVILNMLPPLVHKIVGWLIVGSAILLPILSLFHKK